MGFARFFDIFYTLIEYTKTKKTYPRCMSTIAKSHYLPPTSICRLGWVMLDYIYCISTFETRRWE